MNEKHNSSYIVIKIIMIALFLSLVYLSVLFAGNSIINIEDDLVFVIDEPEQCSVSVWRDDQTGVCYVFLPSYSDMRNVFVAPECAGIFSIEDTLLDCEKGSIKCNFGTEYTISWKSLGLRRNDRIIFLKSENVPTMFIDTESGSLESIYLNKEHKEKAKIIVIGDDGSINYEGEGLDKIKGRGNATWKLEKKPYSITLEDKAELLGMKSARKWVLLANGFDETNMRNKVVYDIGKELIEGWSPSCEFVDLYINGEYLGLYLLSEKVECSDNRLQIGENGFLCCLDGAFKVDINNSIYTSIGNAIEICEPKNCSSSNIEAISTVIQTMENLMLRGDKEDIRSVIDVDSWAYRYIVDTVFENHDGGVGSVYLYCVDMYKDCRIYAGPLWDYDMTVGSLDRNNNPRILMSDSCYPGFYYQALEGNPEFLKRVKELYIQEFEPIIQEYMANQFKIIANGIEDASIMNSIRWRQLLDDVNADYQPSVRTVDDYYNYLEQRLEFLNSVFEREYVTVNVNSKIPELFSCYAVESGTPIGEFEEYIKSQTESKFSIYCDTDTIIMSNEIIEKEITITIKEGKIETILRLIDNNKMVFYSLLAMFFTFLIILVKLHTVIVKRRMRCQ